jgi:hypothetical protein
VIIRINEAKDSFKRLKKKKELRKRISGKFKNMGNADENKLKKILL